MDSGYFGYSITGANLYYPSYPAVSSTVPSPFDSVKLGSANSPDSPFAIHFETETAAAYCDSQEQQSSCDNFSEATFSNSLLDDNSYLQQTKPSCFRHQSSLPFHSGRPVLLPNENHYQSVRHALQELESALMAPDDDEEVATSRPSLGGNLLSQTVDQRSRSWNQDAAGSRLHLSQSPTDSYFGSSNNQIHFREGIVDFGSYGIPPNNLKQLLIACAKALYDDRLNDFYKLVEHARAIVSISGEPIQRLGAYMIEGLIAKKESSGTNIYRTLNCNEPDSKELLSYMHILYEVCPYLKFGYMAVNGAIAEACRNEDRIHIIDFQIAQGTQWMTLLQALAARPSGAPHVRITGIDDPVSRYARGDGLAAVGRRLASISEKFNITVEFHAVPVFAPNVTREMLQVRPDEALAVNFPLQLHHTPDESVAVSNPRDGVLRMVRSLSPKVVTLVEQESNTNTAPFLPRFKEALE